MRRLLGITLLAASALALPRPAAAGASTDAALALGAFAVFNQLVRGETVFHAVVPRPPVIVHAPPRLIYVPAPVTVPPPVVHRAPVVVHPHGRWLLSRGHRVWVPAPPGHRRHWHRH